MFSASMERPNPAVNRMLRLWACLRPFVTLRLSDRLLSVVRSAVYVTANASILQKEMLLPVRYEPELPFLIVY